MKFILCVCFSMTVLLGSVSFQAHGDEQFAYERLLPVPLSETREAVLRWLNSHGFHRVQVAGNPLNDSGVQIAAQKKDTAWTIRLQPHSALGTRVEVVLSRDEISGQIDAFWAYLDERLETGPSRSAAQMRDLPVPVENLRKAAVCIHARRNGTPFQLSGFAIDRTGLIATTAHDLKAGQTVIVKLYNGVQMNGQVVRLDAGRDLSLIQVQEALETVVSLREGRYMPAVNDALFACGCPGSESHSIQTGSLYGPPRKVAGQLLWQVHMQIEPGSSGSPVFDEMGRVVAVVKGRYRGAHHIGFLIPYETLLEFLEINLK
jgi:serine protease Do